VPKTRTPRELLLAALERRRLTGFRSSRELAWVVFPPVQEGGTSLEVMHLPRVNRYRVISSETNEASTTPATTLGDFRSGEAAAALVEDVLAADVQGLVNGTAHANGVAHTNGAGHANGAAQKNGAVTAK
jgi:hypothetical protein